MTRAEITQAVDKGMEFLARRQLPSGQFPIELTYPVQGGLASRPDEALFATAHVVYSLGFLPHPPAQTMISRALAYLQAEMSGSGLWRHWNKTAKQGTRNLAGLIPADLDDMSCISFVLRRQGVAFPENRDLMLLNRNAAGLFYTWLMLRPRLTLSLRYWRTMLAEFTLPRFTIFFTRTQASYRDVDGVVNANVLLYLGERAETQRVLAWLIKVVQTGAEADCDKWYRGPFTFYYALSRNRHAGIQAFDAVKALILERIEAAVWEGGQIGENALQTALAANALLNFEERAPSLERAIDFLLRAQDEDGGWSSAPFYFGGPKKEHSWGSRELTTGLCLEALQRFHV